MMGLCRVFKDPFTMGLERQTRNVLLKASVTTIFKCVFRNTDNSTDNLVYMEILAFSFKQVTPKKVLRQSSALMSADCDFHLCYCWINICLVPQTTKPSLVYWSTPIIPALWWYLGGPKILDLPELCIEDSLG